MISECTSLYFLCIHVAYMYIKVIRSFSDPARSRSNWAPSSSLNENEFDSRAVEAQDTRPRSCIQFMLEVFAVYRVHRLWNC